MVKSAMRLINSENLPIKNPYAVWIYARRLGARLSIAAPCACRRSPTHPPTGGGPRVPRGSWRGAQGVPQDPRDPQGYQPGRLVRLFEIRTRVSRWNSPNSPNCFANCKAPTPTCGYGRWKHTQGFFLSTPPAHPMEMCRRPSMCPSPSCIR
jgi:hypothetical protein